MFYQHTKFTFSQLDKKIKTCLFLPSVTLRVNNEIGSNFDSCHLKDCTSWIKYKNVIFSAISVSSYGLIKLHIITTLAAETEVTFPSTNGFGICPDDIVHSPDFFTGNVLLMYRKRRNLQKLCYLLMIQWAW